MGCKEKSIEQVENGLRKEYFIKGDKLKSISEVMKDIKIPGISVAVINNSEIVWSKGYGVSDAETKAPVDTNTIFQAASISKPITALAVMKLVQEGKLDLDENINSYLRSWKLQDNEFTAKNKVTLRNLLSHTAGVTVHGFAGYSIDAEIPNLVQVLNGEHPANNGKIFVDMEPNTETRYSGGGTTIVQQVLIDQLEKPFEEIMRELVLDPLGMTNSFYSNCPLNEKQSANATSAHDGDGMVVPGKRQVYPEMAAAGLWTTAEDLAKFSIEVQKSLKGESNKILTKEFMDIMTTPVLNGECNIGLFNEKICREELLGHTGGNKGYGCIMLFHKEKGFGIDIMTNSDRGFEIIMPLIRSVAASYNWDEMVNPNYERVDLSEDTIKLFSGNYRMSFDKSVKIFRNDERVVYKTAYGETKNLDYVGNNIFLDESRTFKIEFKEECGKLYVNEKEVQPLNNEEKLASNYIEEGNIEEAVRFYENFMKKDESIKKSLENSLNNDGYSCANRKNYKGAIAFLKVASELFSESGNIWDSLGEVYFLDKKYELTIEAMKKSLNFNPNNSNAVKYIEKAEAHLK